MAKPKPELSGFIKTLNHMGYMTSTLDPVSQQFVEFSAHAHLPVLDIGAAYGVATLECLKLGAQVIANDLDERHLDILWEETPAPLQSKLQLKSGAFPEEVDFSENSLGAILISRVLHFFSGPRIQAAVSKLFNWLAPGGRVYIVAETPYLRNFQSFIPTYELRKNRGDPWPGYIEDVTTVAPERAQFLPKAMHLLDPDVLSRVLQETGFHILEARMLSRTDFPSDLRWDGRESVGVIAEKR